MNVMKQNVMDNKRKERCKTCEKQCMQKNLDGSRGVKILSSRSQPRSIAIEDLEEILIDPPSCREAIEIVIKRS